MALIPIEQIGNPPSVPPTAANPSVVINTPSSTPSARTSPNGRRPQNGRRIPTPEPHHPGLAGRHRPNSAAPSASTAERVRNLRCSDQHLLANCNTCHLYYHLGCSNPPLTRHHQKVQTGSAPSVTNRTTSAPSS
ncbi:uncharacterized protein LOC119768616 [Culex quinquefasciatus]|uniref:uncharacterized protein LOC119768616 n=1 Tax=Culex quinquefasciatus TaxID=7176 RepID=UPI0018E3A73C|nr:uncharacterized protein LOC119768616 [Culex quinquefasciatus]